MAALKVVHVPDATKRALLDGHTLRPMGDGPPKALLRPLEALFQAGDRAVREPQEESNG